MKKILVHSLVFLLVITGFIFAPTLSQDVDGVSAASIPWVEPAAPAPAPAPAPVTAPKPAPVTTVAPAGTGTYIVVSGDTMFKIAAKYSMTLDKLLSLNPQVTNRNLIFVNQKIYITAAAAPTPETNGTTTTTAAKTYQGLGYDVSFRNGPGAWPEEGADMLPVYSFNVAMASATFDANGKILNVFMDGYEIATPNYDGASMPHFSGWPGMESYKVTDHTTLAVSDGPEINATSAGIEVNGWLTKRQRGENYGMNPANEWYKQMNFYQNFFIGKTVAEVKAWFGKYGTSAYGPIKADTTNAADLAKYNALTAAEKASLADVVSGATMRVNDAHGYFIDALQTAYDNRVLVE